MRFGATGCASGLAMLRKSPVICGLGEDEGGRGRAGGGEKVGSDSLRFPVSVTPPVVRVVDASTGNREIYS